MITMGEAVDRFRAAGRPSDLIQGVTLLDPMGGGFAPGDLWLIVGGRRVGLTATGLTLARQLASAGIDTVLAIGDTGRDGLITRLVSATTRMLPHRISPFSDATLRPEERERLIAALEEIRALPLRFLEPAWAAESNGNDVISRLAEGDMGRVLIIDDADAWERRLGPGTPGRLKDLAQRWNATVIALCHFGHDRPIRRKHPRDEWVHWERSLDATVILDRPGLHNPLNVRIAEMDAYAWSTRAPMMQETFVFQGHICSIAGPFPLPT